MSTPERLSVPDADPAQQARVASDTDIVGVTTGCEASAVHTHPALPTTRQIRLPPVGEGPAAGRSPAGRMSLMARSSRRSPLTVPCADILSSILRGWSALATGGLTG